MTNEFKVKWTKLKDTVDQRMMQLVQKERPVSLYDPLKYCLSSGGKRIRPLLLLLSAETVGGDIQNALDAAVALEMVHNFTLVHDDIMDHDDMRRGRQTVHKKWDENAAILAGDALLVVAYDTLADISPIHLQEISKHFSSSILEVCEGQALDKEFESRPDVTLDEYFEMIGKKTARLFAASCTIGAILGEGSEEQIKALQSYGELLGIAFQVQDDLLDILSEQNVLGKDRGSDFEQNKKTFLITHAEQFAEQKYLDQLQEMRKNKHLGIDHLKKIIDILHRCGTIEAAKLEIRSCLEKARTKLGVLEDNEARKFLYELSSTIEQRES